MGEGGIPLAVAHQDESSRDADHAPQRLHHLAIDLGPGEGLAFGLMNACWGVGALIGPAAGGALAGAAGDTIPYLILAGLCLATWAATRVGYAEPVGDLP